MKWSVIFLLLVNALVLFGFSMRQSGSVGDDEVLPSLQTIRLVNESDQILAGNEQPSVTKANDAHMCYDYVLRGSDRQITQISDFLVEQGLDPVIHNLVDDRFKISVLIPDDEQIDRKMINKINEILLDGHSGLKIGKKVCKGLASIKPDH